MDKKILLERLKKTFPKAKINNRKHEISFNVDLNADTNFEAFFVPSDDLTKPIWKFAAKIRCNTVETLVHAIWLSSYVDEFHLTKTLEYSLKDIFVKNNDEYIISNWGQLFEWLNNFATKYKDKKETLTYIYNELKPTEIHLDNVPVAGSYQHRMVAAIIIAMITNRDEVLPLFNKWRKVVIYDFDVEFLNRLEYMFQQYSAEELLAKPMEIFYQMSARYGNPFLKAKSRQSNLLKEVSIAVEGKFLQVIFNSMPPDGFQEHTYWDNLHHLMAKQLEVKVSRDDREVFLLHDKSVVTKAKLKAWLRSFWQNHPDAPTE